ncbi:undecaprenyldiphospho-muramoylpentapeptide beta-N-acetylglucosaminyltransferase [Teredinibacter sp. KSP-S5-2]|uniref:undecaprenyldiphospho-muramoylpentapeptide beta-N-acetylglucosaminyltransferase n=1 Tax=Teredinibacter sp. KSP-S5-2 TaxID=3034506 RepID=UPI002934C718|nr:undecaprenyldiphospho-muramoylpentapeptide beta-N-acetylglucosaminyltransferase [Teredinibacter sp. KSP-S5-2]WNO09618.1 undecaprenyldiphospho-muramoylpentapeptide beta-N-acetylglucosaminyltransferase [Teredinibacter sp. KSP-S5-2]
MPSKHVLIMAGGTGGHVYPGLAVAKKFMERGYRPFWLGTNTGIEARLVPENDIELKTIKVKGIRGKGLVTKLMSPFWVFSAVLQARKVLRDIQPECVVGFGGYASGPGGVAAYLMGIPLVIHEQNAVAGTTNKLLANFANKVVEAFPKTIPDAECVGNPVRKEIVAIDSPEIRLANRGNTLNVLVIGGSLGARALNQFVPEALAKLKNETELSIKHQTGKGVSADIQQAYDEHELRCIASEYIDDMAEAFSWADFIICRSGALTVSEVACVGLPGLFIPFPYAIDDHQTKNAVQLESVGAGVIMQQAEVTAETLAQCIRENFLDRTRLTEMAINARKTAIPNADKKIVSICEALINA